MSAVDQIRLHVYVVSDIFYYLVQSRLTDPNKRDDEGFTLLHRAAQSGKNTSRIVQLLLDKGADVDSRTPKGHTPLHFAVFGRKRREVVSLLGHLASVNAEDNLGRTPLHYAVLQRWVHPPDDVLTSTCDVWIVKKLLSDERIIVDAVDQWGETPLMRAVKERHVEAVRSLLKKGANPNIPNKANRTPLHKGLLSPIEPLVVLYLFHSGAGLDCADNSKQTPVDMLVRMVRDGKKLLFVTRCIWIISLRYIIREGLKRQLEQIPELYGTLARCCNEINVMKRVILYDKVTLHDFALDCFHPKGLRDIYAIIIEILLSGLFTEYFNLLLYRMSISELHGVSVEIANFCSSQNLPPLDASHSIIFNAIRYFYDTNLELRRRLFWMKKFLMGLYKKY